MSRGILDRVARAELQEHYEAIARILVERHLLRNTWSVDVKGVKYSFAVRAFPRRGSAIAEEIERDKREQQGGQAR